MEPQRQKKNGVARGTYTKSINQIYSLNILRICCVSVCVCLLSSSVNANRFSIFFLCPHFIFGQMAHWAEEFPVLYGTGVYQYMAIDSESN